MGALVWCLQKETNKVVTYDRGVIYKCTQLSSCGDFATIGSSNCRVFDEKCCGEQQEQSKDP